MCRPPLRPWRACTRSNVESASGVRNARRSRRPWPSISIPTAAALAVAREVEDEGRVGDLSRSDHVDGVDEPLAVVGPDDGAPATGRGDDLDVLGRSASRAARVAGGRVVVRGALAAEVEVLGLDRCRGIATGPYGIELPGAGEAGVNAIQSRFWPSPANASFRVCVPAASGIRIGGSRVEPGAIPGSAAAMGWGRGSGSRRSHTSRTTRCSGPRSLPRRAVDGERDGPGRCSDSPRGRSSVYWPACVTFTV